jgi:hypothetical protein
MKAFPIVIDRETQLANDTNFAIQEDGMDLRDYFAAKAMQGMATWDIKTMSKLAEDFGEEPLDYLSRNAYSIADAMMKAREK